MPSPCRLMPAGKTLERDQVVNQRPSIWGFITLHQSIVYPWTQLSDFSHIRQRPASNPEILTLCDPEGRILYSPGITLSALKGERMDTSGKTTEKGFYRRRWGLGTAGASPSPAHGAPPYMCSRNLASLFTRTVLQPRKLCQEPKACGKGCQSWMDWHSLGLRKLLGSHAWRGLFHIWCADGLLCCPQQPGSKPVSGPQIKGGLDTLGFSRPGSWGPGMLESCLANPPFPLQFLGLLSTHKTKPARESKSRRSLLSLWLADGWKVSFKEWNRKKTTYPNLSWPFCFYLKHINVLLIKITLNDPFKEY